MAKNESNKGKRILRFRFLGKDYPVDTWKELLISVSEILYDEHSSVFYDKAKELRGSKLTYFSKNREGMREPREVGDTSIYVETKWDADAMEKISRELIRHFGYSDRDLTISKF